MKIKTLMLCATVLLALSGQTQAADTIKLGLVAESSGANAEAGIYQINGAKMAVEEVNAAGGVLGRQFELKIEDNQSTNPGSVLALSKLTSPGDLTALIGSIRSTQIQAMGPTVMKTGIPMIMGLSLIHI